MTENQDIAPETNGNSWRKAVWAGALLTLALPLIAMQFTNEVNWDLADFVIFGLLMGGAIITYELAAKKTGNKTYKIAVSVALLAAFLLIWVNGAVGIIGNESNDANLMFLAVLMVGLIGSLIARFRPEGMALAMYATAAAQAVVFVVALVAGWGFIGPVTVFFVALWLVSARLFQQV